MKITILFEFRWAKWSKQSTKPSLEKVTANECTLFCMRFPLPLLTIFTCSFRFGHYYMFPDVHHHHETPVQNITESLGPFFLTTQHKQNKLRRSMEIWRLSLMLQHQHKLLFHPTWVRTSPFPLLFSSSPVSSILSGKKGLSGSWQEWRGQKKLQ